MILAHRTGPRWQGHLGHKLTGRMPVPLQGASPPVIGFPAMWLFVMCDRTESRLNVVALTDPHPIYQQFHFKPLIRFGHRGGDPRSPVAGGPPGARVWTAVRSRLIRLVILLMQEIFATRTQLLLIRDASAQLRI
jgi:hypothetical protein